MNVAFGGQNGTVTGLTTAAYVVALSIPGNGGLTGKTIFKITDIDGATKTMYYKINGYMSTSPSCSATAITVQTDVVNATPVVDTACLLPYARVEVLVVDHSDHCNYQIDYMTY
jgi:hypothetical protein